MLVDMMQNEDRQRDESDDHVAEAEGEQAQALPEEHVGRGLGAVEEQGDADDEGGDEADGHDDEDVDGVAGAGARVHGGGIRGELWTHCLDVGIVRVSINVCGFVLA